jgi:hypothetical protein
MRTVISHPQTPSPWEAKLPPQVRSQAKLGNESGSVMQLQN